MKITLKTIILAALIVFNLVIIISNFTTYEGLESNTSDAKPKKEKSAEELQAETEPTKEDINYGIVGEGDMAKS
jgi:hypothetical protein